MRHVVVLEEEDSDYDLPDITGPFETAEAALLWAVVAYGHGRVKGNWYVQALNEPIVGSKGKK